MPMECVMFLAVVGADPGELLPLRRDNAGVVDQQQFHRSSDFLETLIPLEALISFFLT